MDMQNSNMTLDPPTNSEVEWTRTLGKIYRLYYDKDKTRVEKILDQPSLDRLYNHILAAPNQVITQC